MDHTYGGEIDVLPTLEDLLGISSNKYLQFGQDLLSPERNQIVAFRNGDWVTPNYTKFNGDYYQTANGKPLKHLNASQQRAVDKIQQYVTTELGLSDKVINGDLLRFYHLPDFTKVKKSDYNYNVQKGLAQLKRARKAKKTSLMDQNGGTSSFDQYSTNAPEIAGKSLKFPTR